MLINLGRRSQNLLGRMLAQVTELERAEQDPDTLSELFRLDHAATRVRRNAESMLVLQRAPPRPGPGPARLPCMDVVRAALSEIEEYTRVDLHHVEDSAVHGTAVADVAAPDRRAGRERHPLLAAEHPGQRDRPGGPRGVPDPGHRPGRRDDPPGAGRRQPADPQHRNLVVGREAAGPVRGRPAGPRRRGIEVTLEPSAGRGITATVMLPRQLLASEAQRRSPDPGRSAVAPPSALSTVPPQPARTAPAAPPALPVQPVPGSVIDLDGGCRAGRSAAGDRFCRAAGGRPASGPGRAVARPGSGRRAAERGGWAGGGPGVPALAVCAASSWTSMRPGGRSPTPRHRRPDAAAPASDPGAISPRPEVDR